MNEKDEQINKNKAMFFFFIIIKYLKTKTKK